MKMRNSFFQLFTLTVLLALPLRAQTPPPLLNINLGASNTNKVGFAAIGETSNDYWNGYEFGGLTYGAVSNLEWADRSASGINLTVLNAPGVWGNTTGDGMYDVFIYPWNGGNDTAILSNVPDGSYDLYLYGHSANASENSKFQVTIGASTTVWKQTQDSTNAATSTNWVEGIQYVVFRNLAVSSGQPVVITCAPGDSGSAVFNGLQIISNGQPPPVTNSSLLNLNFGAYDTNKVGFAAIGQTTNDYWEGIDMGSQNNGAFPDLKWADRNDSGINLTILNAPGGWYNTTGDGMYDSYIYPLNGGDITVTFSNVPPTSYDFYLYGHSGNAWENSKFQITVGTNTTAWEQTQDSTLAGTSTNWAEGVQYVVFRNVTVSSGQAVVITCAPGDAGAAVFNGLQMISSGTQQTPPAITSFTPASGTVGTNVTITGLNFSPVASDNIVYFGAVRATVTAASVTNLVVTVPAGATYAPITATVDGLTAYADQPFMPTFLGNGQIDSSSLGPQLVLPAGSNPNKALVADLDGDGKPDLIVLNANSISLYRNISTNGALTTGSFAPPVDLLTPGNTAYGLAVADVDGDGKLDIIAADNSVNLVSVYRNTSTPGNISSNSFATRVDFATGAQPQRVAVADLDGDGRPDLLVANSGDGTISILRNTSVEGSLTANSFAPKVDIATGTGCNSVAVGDLDGDGKPDVAAVNSGNNTLSLLRNISAPGSIAFAAKADITVLNGLMEVAIGDLDGDGKPDLAVTCYLPQTVSVLRNISTVGSLTTNSFAPEVDFPLGGRGHSPAIADLDGDGKPDLAVVTELNSLLSIFHNVSTPGSFTTNSFAPRVDFATGYNAWGVAIGDLNEDGRPDIVFCNQYDNTISIYQNIVSTPTPPTITSQPQNAYVDAYGTASFSVTATGASSYQWLFNGSSVLNATSSTLTISNVEQSDLGPYSVIAANSYGAVTSSIANLYMFPAIINPFTGLVANWGQNTTLSVGAWGSGALTFQWYDNGIAIPDATNSTLNFSALQFTNAGLYSVVVSSSLGSVTNAPAQLVVNPAGVSLGLYPGVTVTGTVGYTYLIQSNPDLTNTNGWTTVATLTLSQRVQLWVDVNHNAASPTNQHRFYRVMPGP